MEDDIGVVPGEDEELGGGGRRRRKTG